MDNFAEQLVKPIERKADKLVRACIIVMGLCGAAACLMFTLAMLAQGKSLFSLIGIILAIGAVIGTHFWIQSTKVEYEYIFTNGTLDIDKIIAKKRRASLISVDVKKFTAIGEYDAENDDNDVDALIFAFGRNEGTMYFANFTDDSYGAVRLVFLPNEKMIANIRRFLPAKLRVNLPDIKLEEE